jgi:hypothetical protein
MDPEKRSQRIFSRRKRSGQAPQGAMPHKSEALVDLEKALAMSFKWGSSTQRVTNKDVPISFLAVASRFPNE